MPGSGKSKVVVKTEDEDERFVSLRGVLDTKSGEVGIAFSAKDDAIFNAFKASVKPLLTQGDTPCVARSLISQRQAKASAAAPALSGSRDLEASSSRS